MLLVTFALPEESVAFRKLLRRGGAEVALGSSAMRIVHVGVGAPAARAGLRVLLAQTKPCLVCAAGFAGGLDPRVRTGDLVLDPHLSDAAFLSAACQALEPVFARAHPDAVTTSHARFWHGPIFSSAHALESVGEKQACFLRTRALAVDMETAALAEECRAAGVPFMAIRVISDDAASDLPVPISACFDLHRQRPNTSGLVRYLALHPQRIVPFIRFVASLRAARLNLAHALVLMFKEPSRAPWRAGAQDQGTL
jgi:adenosylhomocysteine nucleosidase